MRKADFIDHWQGIEADQELKVAAVPYKHQGSTYAEDGIRITGTRDFIDSVLSRLKDMLKAENGRTRLQVVYKESTDRHTGVALDSYNCYIQVHERGGQAQMTNAILGI